MRFIALVKRELRENLLWMILAAVIFAFIGTLIFVSHVSSPHTYYSYWQTEPGRGIRSDNFIQPPKALTNIGPLLLIISIILGLVLAARQFLEQNMRKTWAFTIHRSVTRSTIVWSKFTAAAVIFVLSLGLIWTAFFFCAAKLTHGIYSVVNARTLLDGWIFIIMGLIIYFATVLASISTRSQRIRICSLGFAPMLIILTMTRLNLLYSFLVIVLGLIILLSQIFYVFLRREF